MAKYTVVVHYPAHCDCSEMDTFTAHVEAASALAARKVGATQAWRRQPPGERGQLRDWLPLVVFEGHLKVAAWGWQSPDWRSTKGF